MGNVIIHLISAAENFRPILCEEEVHGAYEVVEDKDLGFMLYDMDYSNPEDIQPMFFRAVMRRGIVDLKDCEVIR